MGERFLEDYWEDEDRSSFGVSPDGRFVSYMETKGEISTLRVFDFEKDAEYSLSSERDSSIAGYEWIDAETIAIREFAFSSNQMPRSYISSYNYRLRRQNADFNRPSRLSMEKNHRDILPGILHGLPSIEGAFLIAEPTVSFFYNPGRARGSYGDLQAKVHWMDVNERKSSPLIEVPEFDSYIPRPDGQIPLAFNLYGENKGIFHRETDEAAWSKLPLPEETYPVGFLPGGEHFLVSYVPEGEDKRVVQAYDLSNRRWASQPIRDPDYDVTVGGNEWPRVHTDQATGYVMGITYERDKPKTIWFDPAYAQVQTFLEKTFPDQVVSIYGYVQPINSILFHLRTATAPPQVLLFSMETRQITNFQKEPPEFNYTYNGIQPVAFQSRDDVTIRGYMTLPAEYTEGNPVPFAVIVKGGPMGRTGWASGIDFFEAQWLSMMGFGVLQVDYRGSTGYGDAYSGVHETQNTTPSLFAAQKGVEDVVDGTRWAIEQGYAREGSIILMGASFGGYVSGMAPVVEPDLYAITLPAMGVYDWLQMIEFDRKISHPLIWEALKDRYGDYEVFESEYKKWAPAEHADKIRIPVCLIHGKNDARVDEEQARIYENALKKAGVDFESHYYTRGGHGFGDQAGWTHYYGIILDFIWEHLPSE